MKRIFWLPLFISIQFLLSCAYENNTSTGNYKGNKQEKMKRYLQKHNDSEVLNMPVIATKPYSVRLVLTNPNSLIFLNNTNDKKFNSKDPNCALFSHLSHTDKTGDISDLANEFHADNKWPTLTVVSAGKTDNKITISFLEKNVSIVCKSGDKDYNLTWANVLSLLDDEAFVQSLNTETEQTEVAKCTEKLKHSIKEADESDREQRRAWLGFAKNCYRGVEERKEITAEYIMKLKDASQKCEALMKFGTKGSITCSSDKGSSKGTGNFIYTADGERCKKYDEEIHQAVSYLSSGAEEIVQCLTLSL